MFLELKNSSDPLLKSDAYADQNQVFFYLALGEIFK